MGWNRARTAYKPRKTQIWRFPPLGFTPDAIRKLDGGCSGLQVDKTHSSLPYLSPPLSPTPVPRDSGPQRAHFIFLTIGLRVDSHGGAKGKPRAGAGRQGGGRKVTKGSKGRGAKWTAGPGDPQANRDA